ncbi:MAG TPA: DUF2283 domain-containing protein [Trebonia sp.]|jgi:uncharacterized protein YuzE
MKLEYDLNAGALYIRLSDAEIARSVEAGDNAAVDLDASGDVVGIEVIAVGYPWPLADILAAYSIPPKEVTQLKSYFCVEKSPVLPRPQISTGSPAPAMAAG